MPVWSAMRTQLWPDPENNNASELSAYFAGNSEDIKQAFIAEFASRVVGVIELNIRNSAAGSNHTQVPYVEAWYVAPEFQGRGYGRQLVEKAEQWALNAGYTELASDTQISNKNSISAHQQLGFSEIERIVCFLKPLK